MADGRKVRVAHPEFMATAPPARTIVVYQPDGSFEIVDILFRDSVESPGERSVQEARLLTGLTMPPALDQGSSMKHLIIVLGLALCSDQVVAETNRRSTDFALPGGLRVIAIGRGPVTNALTSVKPGDRVDILATYLDPRTKQAVTKMLVQNVLVHTFFRKETDPSHGREDLIALEVPTEQAEVVGAADRAGALEIQLHPHGNERIIPNEGETARGFGSGQVQEQTPASTGTPVIIILSPDRSRNLIGDFWLPGEFERALEERKQQRRQESEP